MEIEANKTKKTQKKKRSRKGSKETTESPKTTIKTFFKEECKRDNTIKCKEAKPTQYK